MPDGYLFTYNQLHFPGTRWQNLQIEHELGDVLFALVNLSRFLGLNPEVAMISVNERFERRFREMEKLAAESGSSIEAADMPTLDRLWEEAKKRTG